MPWIPKQSLTAAVSTALRPTAGVSRVCGGGGSSCSAGDCIGVSGVGKTSAHISRPLLLESHTFPALPQATGFPLGANSTCYATAYSQASQRLGTQEWVLGMSQSNLWLWITLVHLGWWDMPNPALSLSLARIDSV